MCEWDAVWSDSSQWETEKVSALKDVTVLVVLVQCHLDVFSSVHFGCESTQQTCYIKENNIII